MPRQLNRSNRMIELEPYWLWPGALSLLIASVRGWSAWFDEHFAR